MELVPIYSEFENRNPCIKNTVTRRGARLVRRVLDWIIAFVAPSAFTQLGTRSNYSAIAILHTFQFTVTHHN
jgi:hypothetical protein